MRFHPHISPKISLSLLVCAVVGSCGKCSTTTENEGNFVIASSESDCTIQAGASESMTITVTRSGGFTNAVTLAAQGVPTGVTATFTPASVAAGSTSSTLSLTVASTATPGVQAITIVGSASGMANKQVTMTMTITPAPVGGFTISLNPATVSVQQGQAGVSAVTITRTAPFAGAVNLVLDGAPTGVTAAFNPGAIPAGSTTATATITVAASVAAGVYPLNVHGSGTGGVADQLAPLSLTVTTPGSFTLSINPATLSVQQGQGGTTAVTIARTAPFAGAVNLVLDGAPTGVTAAFNPGPIPAGSTTSTATISVAASVATGVYSLNVHGSATGGVTDRLAPLSLTVTAAPPPTRVDLLFCQLDAIPVWLGYQDGNGPWQHLIGVNGTFSFDLTADRGAVAYVRQVTELGVTSYDVSLVYATRAEFIDAAPLACASSQPVKTLTGSVAGITGADFFALAVGSGYTEFMPGAGPNYTIENVEIGVRDLIAGRLRTNLTLQPADLIFRRGTNYTAGSAIPVLDFSSGEAFAAETRTATVVGLNGDPWQLTDDYITANRTWGNLPIRTPTTAVAPFATVPSAQVLAGDVYNLKAVAYAMSGAATREVTNSFTTAADQTLSLGGYLVEPAVFTLSAAPFYQVRITTTLQGDYVDVFSGRYRQPDRTGVVYVTRGWLGGNTVNITTPDLTAVPGWQATFGPRPGVTTTLIARGIGLVSSGGSLRPLWGEAITVGGVVIKSATLSKQVVP